MRISVLVVGILGALSAGALGAFWLLDCQMAKSSVEKSRAMVALLRQGGGPLPPFLDNEVKKAEDVVQTYDRHMRAYPFLLAGLVLGGAGAALGMAGRGLSAAALLLVSAVGPAVLDPRSLIFTGLLIVAGGLAFFIRPPAPAPEPEPARTRPPLEAEPVDDAGLLVEPEPSPHVKQAGRGA